jgi:hypothetical protein
VPLVSLVEIEFRNDIERVLGRGLRDDELVFAGSLEKITNEQRRVAKRLVHEDNSVLSALYIHSLAGISPGEAERFVEQWSRSRSRVPARASVAIPIEPPEPQRTRPKWPFAVGGLAAATTTVAVVISASATHERDDAIAERDHAMAKRDDAIVERDHAIAKTADNVRALNSAQASLEKVKEKADLIEEVAVARYPDVPKERAMAMLADALTSSAGLLSSEDKDRLVSELVRRRSAKYNLVCPDPQKIALCTQIFQVLNKAGWGGMVERGGVHVPPDAPKSWYVTTRSDRSESNLVAESLRDAFAVVGKELPFVRHAWYGLLETDADVIIVIQ